jgi:AraC-like DNA-binding protein
MLHKETAIGELSIAVTGASSPLIHDCIPSPADTARRFFLLLPNKRRRLDVADQRLVQPCGEWALADSTIGHSASYEAPHATICLSIPGETLRRYVPEAAALGGIWFASDRTLARLVSMLLLSLWTSAEEGTGHSDGRRAADGLLSVLARCYARLPARRAAPEGSSPISCEQIKQVINAEIRNPALSVQFVARRFGVTTRYLQLLFAKQGECVSEYIKCERLRGCLLDLRDSSFDRQSITDIAFSWGFNSAAHFSASFRKEYGLSPRDYRSCDAEQLAASPLAHVEPPLVEALLLLERPARGARRENRLEVAAV